MSIGGTKKFLFKECFSRYIRVKLLFYKVRISINIYEKIRRDYRVKKAQLM
jgi:hypothetical protein